MARRFRSSRLPTPTSRRSKPACISPWIGRAPFGSSEIDYDFQKMSSRAQIEKLTGIASRFGAFVAERHPFALTDATDNRLKTFFMTGEIKYGGAGFQGKGFRSLGQEAIYAAAIRLRRGAAYRSADGRWNGDVIGPVIRDLGATLAMRSAPDTV